MAKNDTAAPKKAAASKAAAPEVEAEEEKKEVANVHQVLHTTDGRWAVKRKNSDKVIKYFTTKKEALEYVTAVCEHQDTKLMVQKKNRAFQKLSNALRGVKKQ
ncbi:MAG: DUF2188 domain-containing protein [Sphaerochaetaceae bacterium]|nr:DUF2188 domain-containing protein [Sphaerochaetaceae bacterium]MDD3164062.1 DUF2188 domain-containing protein [Sphaerochaetaceae bacterium]MDD4397827.1 DUF2188 domain-containing protein [Sphaerochaetaceae bacterium]